MPRSVRSLGSKKPFRKKHPHSHSREVAMQALYQIEVVSHPVEHVLRMTWLGDPMDPGAQKYTEELVRLVTEHSEELDRVIRSISDVDDSKISAIVRSLMKIGIIEMMADQLEPGIIINDILNLTRHYEGDEAVAYVNGVLDRFKLERLSIGDSVKIHLPDPGPDGEHQTDD